MLHRSQAIVILAAAAAQGICADKGVTPKPGLAAAFRHYQPFAKHQIDVSADSGGPLRIEFASVPNFDFDYRPDEVIVSARGEHTACRGDGAITVTGMALAWPDADGQRRYREYYSPDGRRIPFPANRGAIFSGGVLPSLRVDFEARGLASPRFRTLRVLSESGRELLKACAWSTPKSTDSHLAIQCGGALATMRSQPVLVEIDLFHGKPNEHRLPAKPNTQATLDRNSVRILNVVPTVHCRGWSCEQSKSRVAIRGVEPYGGEKRHCTTAIVFFAVPECSARYTIWAEDAEGERLGLNGTAGFKHLLVRGLQARPNDIRTIVVSESPYLLRARFPLPGIPGLPQASQNDRDVLERVIPIARFRYAHEAGQIIKAATELDVVWEGCGTPQLPGTTVLTNLTVAKLLDHLTARHGLSYFVDDDRIVIQPKLGTRMKRWLQRAF